MAQRLLNVRVRPPRAVVLIGRDATESDLLLVFEFFSKIWGVRFGQILAVDPKASDPLTEFRLARSRPEFVYGIGVDDSVWSQVAHQTCQPRKYENLSQDYVRGMNDPIGLHRAAAVEFLGERRSKSAVLNAMTLLSDEDFLVRFATGKAVGRTG